jgi:hypothetical protein
LLTEGEEVQWQIIPGYRSLVHAFMFSLKHENDLSQWKTPAMLQATCSLLENPRLLNIFIKLLYAKTNVHDSSLTERKIKNLK